MKTDLELETWRQEWRDQTEALPELKKKIRRQNLQTVAAVVAVCLCLAVSTVEALRTRSAFVAGLTSGIGFAGAVMGSFVWWVRRGAWKPSAQTTLAYAELSYKRAVAKVRTLHFAFYFLLTAIVAFTAIVGWHWRALHVRDGVILAAMIGELFVFRHLERRKQREVEETRKLIDDLKE